MEPAFAISSFKETYYGKDHLTGSGTVRYNSLGQVVFNGRTLFLGGNTSIPYAYKVLTSENVKTSVGMPKTSETKVEGGMVFSEEGYEEFNALIAGSLKFSGHRILSLVSNE